MVHYSVCAVVRDEEDLIDGMIKACLPYLEKEDELLIMDGGSKDDTVECALDYEDQDPRVEVKWEKQEWDKRKWVDEAAYRNMAWSKCKHNFILSLDSDEAYTPETYKLLHRIGNDKRFKAYYFDTINFVGSTKKIISPQAFPDLHIRFADRRVFQWVGKVHASPWLYGKQPISPKHLIARVLPFHLFHYARARGKADRPYGDIPNKTMKWTEGHPRGDFK